MSTTMLEKLEEAANLAASNYRAILMSYQHGYASIDDVELAKLASLESAFDYRQAKMGFVTPVSNEVYAMWKD